MNNWIYPDGCLLVYLPCLLECHGLSALTYNLQFWIGWIVRFLFFILSHGLTPLPAQVHPKMIIISCCYKERRLSAETNILPNDKKWRLNENWLKDAKISKLICFFDLHHYKFAFYWKIPFKSINQEFLVLERDGR